MSKSFTPQANFKTKTSLLLFGTGWAAPLVLYFDNPQEKYKEFQEILSAPSKVRVLEFDANGPIKKVSVISSQITAVALQEEPYIQ